MIDELKLPDLPRRYSWQITLSDSGQAARIDIVSRDGEKMLSDRVELFGYAASDAKCIVECAKRLVEHQHSFTDAINLLGLDSIERL